MINTFETAIKKYYEIVSGSLIESLRKRGWATRFVNSKEEARSYTLNILTRTDYKTIGVPGSVTVRQLGLIEELERRGFKVIHHWLPVSEDEKNRLRIEETRADVFIHSANAITTNGEIIIADFTGNRIVGSTLGPKLLIFVVGVNKIVNDLLDGIKRIREYAAKVNAIRLGLNPEGEYDSFLLVLKRKPPLIPEGHVIIINDYLGY